MIKSTVGLKIGAGFALALLILAVIGTVAYRNTKVLQETANQVSRTHQVLEGLEELRRSLVDAETGQRGYLIVGTDEYLEPYHAGVEAAGETIRKVRQLTLDSPRQQQELNELESLVRLRLARLKEIIDVRRTQGFEPAQALIVAGEGKEQMDAVRALITRMETDENALLRERRQNADRSAQTAMLTIVIGVILALVLLGVVGYVITRNIATPLKNISDAAERIAIGDLNVSLERTDRRDEVGRLTDVFGQMVQSLKATATVASTIASGDLRSEVKPLSKSDVLGNAFAEMVKSLRSLASELIEGVGVLGTSANEISTSTSQLATSATETATAIGETSTTVEEVKQTAQLSSQKAKTVSDTAQKAAQIAQAGKTATDETVQGMNRIREQMSSIAESMMRLSEQSQAIGQIVATVEDLAAQSNLLAVNAAIEAAKAGEHGKGFAVVAQEVKSLADQSKQATAQVRTILTDIQKATSSAVLATEQGSKAVDAGVRQSTQAGQSIQTLSNSATEAAQAAAQIAASSQQQLVGVDQVAQAVVNIRQASTQNVDSAKQLEGAARDLKELGDKLKQLVDRYRI